MSVGENNFNPYPPENRKTIVNAKVTHVALSIQLHGGELVAKHPVLE